MIGSRSARAQTHTATICIVCWFPKLININFKTILLFFGKHYIFDWISDRVFCGVAAFFDCVIK